MAITRDVDVLPNGFSPNGADDAKAETLRLQKNRWRVLFITLCLFLVASLGWVWSRPALYQSQAILHFSYPQEFGQDLSSVPVEQLELNQQRLVSVRVLEMVKERLADKNQLQMDVAQLSAIASAESNLQSRVINLYATGENKNLLAPVLDAWLDVYLASLALETESRTVEDLEDIDTKIAALDEKIAEQQEAVERFAETHNIVSLERDENRTLNKIKGLSASLDKADAAVASATAELKNAREAQAAGESLIHPADAGELNALQVRITGLQNELEELAQRYTEEYMNLDPAIVSKKRALQKANEQLQQRVEQSKANYLRDLSLQVSQAEDNGNELNNQLIALTREAQRFNAQLREYEQLNTTLQQLEQQAQNLRNRAVEKEIEKPFVPKITVLESPFTPTKPISPDYWLDSAIAAAASLVASLLCLLVYSFIVRQHQAPTTVTSYTVVPGSAHALAGGHQAALDHQATQQLGHQAAPAQLEQKATPQATRLLTTQECQQMYTAGNRQTQALIMLLLHGVAVEELADVVIETRDHDQLLATVNGTVPRTIVLPSSLPVQSFDSLVSQQLSVEDLDIIVVNAAHDAGINFADDVSVAAFRHTYLTFLVSQGTRLNDLERFAGDIKPAELARYRQVNRNGQQIESDSVEPSYPIDW